MAEVGEGCQRSGGSKHGRVADGQDGDEDDGVHDGWEDLDTGFFDGNDKGGGLGVGSVFAINEAGVVVWN